MSDKPTSLFALGYRITQERHYMVKPPHPLRTLRDSKCFSIKGLAQASGVGERTIQNIELEGISPRMMTRRRLLIALDIPFNKHLEVFGPLTPNTPPRDRHVESLEAKIHELLGVLSDNGLLPSGSYTFYDGQTWKADTK